jgi:hypothetical protein
MARTDHWPGVPRRLPFGAWRVAWPRPNCYCTHMHLQGFQGLGAADRLLVSGVIRAPVGMGDIRVPGRRASLHV